MSCISRRAHADRYNFKLFKQEGETIKEKNCVWTEYKCKNVVLDGKLVCAECDKKIVGHRFQASGHFNHGTVNGPYTADSKLYGSPYYLKCINSGWKIKEEDEKRAKDAQLKANMAPRKPKVDDSGSPVKVAVSSPAGSPASSVEKPKQPRKPRVVKLAKKSSEPNLVSLASPSVAQVVEVVTLPIVATEVIVVKVKKIRHDGKDYYFDSASGKTYEAKTSGVGKYVGRYNPDANILDNAYPDSDEE